MHITFYDSSKTTRDFTLYSKMIYAWLEHQRVQISADRRPSIMTSHQIANDNGGRKDWVVSSPQQTNAYDCGIFTALNAALLATGQPINECHQASVTTFRTWFTLEIKKKAEEYLQTSHPIARAARDVTVMKQRKSERPDAPEGPPPALSGHAPYFLELSSRHAFPSRIADPLHSSMYLLKL